MNLHQHSGPQSDDYRTNRRALTLALVITSLMMLAELGGGIWSGSLALISDAGHMLTDTGALALALFSLWISRRPATPEKTYGYYRAEILSALINGAFLLVIAGYIFYEAIQRFLNPPIVRGSLMLMIAVIGLLINLAGALILLRASKQNLNVKAALWHILSDAFSSLGVILGALIIVLTGRYFVDPLLGLLIAILIVIGAWRVLKEATEILLEFTPRDINPEHLIQTLKSVKGVREIHDLHIWTLGSGVRALSAHILIDDAMLSECRGISKQLKDLLSQKFRIIHATLEFECEKCSENGTCILSEP